MASVFHEIVVDSEDPEALARFWGTVFGWEPQSQGPSWWMSETGDPSRPPVFVFNPGGGPKETKNRFHIDVVPRGCDQPEEVERLLGLGATRVDIGQGDDVPWVVLADPEGNEFCVLGRRVD